jgi:23S rRNA pseudouridine1911/1915/1917 synthase
MASSLKSARPGRERVFVCELGGGRLDRFLTDKLSDFSRSYVQDLISRGRVTVDGKPKRRDYHLQEEERVKVRLEDASWEGSDFDRWVIFEDKDLLVIDKPAGLLVHPLGPSWLKAPQAALTEREPNLAGLIQKARPQLSRAGLERCGIVHRLDRPTSGVMLVAKTAQAQRGLLEDFKDRSVNKTYWAIVRGSPRQDELVSAPVGRKQSRRTVEVTPYGKTAETALKVLRKSPQFSWVEAKPRTGRTHQIRAHLAWLGHPVAGDPDFDKGAPAPPRMMLHAHRIAFIHPVSGEPVSFKAGAPEDFRTFWAQVSRKTKGRTR